MKRLFFIFLFSYIVSSVFAQVPIHFSEFINRKSEWIDKEAGRVLLPLNPTKVERKTIAKELLKYKEAILKKIPQPSPKELEWLNQELSSGDSKRIAKVLQSNEYAQRTSIIFFVGQIYALKSILEDTTPDKSEYRYWVIITGDLLRDEVENSLRLLCERKIISPNFTSERNSAPVVDDEFSIHMFVSGLSIEARFILEDIVLPYFNK